MKDYAIAAVLDTKTKTVCPGRLGHIITFKRICSVGSKTPM